ncbi:MAG: antitoxin family protein [Armatimonadota bacterium]
MGKHFRAKVKEGRIEPLEPVDLTEGAELEVTVEVSDDGNEWFKEFYDFFVPVREELANVPEETINRRIARAARVVRAEWVVERSSGRRCHVGENCACPVPKGDAHKGCT